MVDEVSNGLDGIAVLSGSSSAIIHKRFDNWSQLGQERSSTGAGVSVAVVVASCCSVSIIGIIGIVGGSSSAAAVCIAVLLQRL